MLRRSGKKLVKSCQHQRDHCIVVISHSDLPRCVSWIAKLVHLKVGFLFPGFSQLLYPVEELKLRQAGTVKKSPEVTQLQQLGLA